MVHYSIYGSLPRYVEQLTHSQQKLDGSLAIKTSFGPQACLIQSISFSLTPSIRVSRAWKCHTESKTSVELGKLLQQLVKLKQHQWPEV
jgi:hypothetical protein